MNVRKCVFNLANADVAICDSMAGKQIEPSHPHLNDDNKIIRKLLALPFIQSDDIAAAFGRLTKTDGEWKQTTSELIALARKDRRSLNISVRTNDDIEGWHNRLKKRACRVMPMYMLFETLKRESR